MTCRHLCVQQGTSDLRLLNERAEVVLSLVLWSCVSDSVTRPPLLLVSLDGLRPEYLQTWHTLLPVLDRLSQ